MNLSNDDLIRRAEIAEAALDALVKKLGQIGGAVIALRVNELEDKASRDGARIGDLERALSLAADRLEKARIAHQRLLSRIGRVETAIPPREAHSVPAR